MSLVELGSGGLVDVRSSVGVASPSSKITISSMEKTERARAIEPARDVRSSSLRLELWISEAGRAMLRVWCREPVGVYVAVGRVVSRSVERMGVVVEVVVWRFVLVLVLEPLDAIFGGM